MCQAMHQVHTAAALSQDETWFWAVLVVAFLKTSQVHFHCTWKQGSQDSQVNSTIYMLSYSKLSGTVLGATTGGQLQL